MLSFIRSIILLNFCFIFLVSAQENTQSKLNFYPHEVHRYKDPQRGLVVVYKVVPTGIPKDQEFILTSSKLDGTKSTEDRVVVNQHNEVINKQYSSPVLLGVHDTAKGEPIIYTLKTIDGSLEVTKTIVAFPIEVEDEHGHTLSLIIANHLADLFEFKAEGFEPNEEVKMILSYGDRKIEKVMHASRRGIIKGGTAPLIPGKIGGEASIEFIGKTTDDLKLDYKWGVEAFPNSKR